MRIERQPPGGVLAPAGQGFRAFGRDQRAFRSTRDLNRREQARSFRSIRSRTLHAPLAHVRSLTFGNLRGPLLQYLFIGVQPTSNICSTPASRRILMRRDPCFYDVQLALPGRVDGAKPLPRGEGARSPLPPRTQQNPPCDSSQGGSSAAGAGLIIFRCPQTCCAAVFQIPPCRHDSRCRCPVPRRQCCGTRRCAPDTCAPPRSGPSAPAGDGGPA